MEIVCNYIKTLEVQEHTVSFLIEPIYGKEPVTCQAPIPRYPYGTPLKVICDTETEVIEYVENEEQAIGFLTTLGVKKAKEKLNGKDIFLSNHLEKKYADIINNIKQERRFISFSSSYHIPIRAAYSFYDEYKEKSIEKIKRNPYFLRFYDVPFSVCETIADAFGIGLHDKRRIDGYLYSSLKQAQDNGNTCVSLHDLCRRAEPLEVASMIVEKPDVYVFHRDCYLKRTYEMEEKSAEHVARLLKESLFQPTKEEIEQTERTLGIEYAPEQKKAFVLGGISVLTGGPGTGKTTTLNGILHCYEKKTGGSIGLCAPTAAAAKRMKEATGRDALTIHKLLDIRPNGFGYTSKTEYDPLPYDLVVVDETSMIDLELFSILVESIKPGARLLLLGDRDQLASVGCGNILDDLIKSDVPQTHLTKIFRQEECSSIVKNSFLIRNCEMPISDDQSEMVFCKTEDEMIETAIGFMKQYYDKEDPWKTRLFTTARNRKFSVSTYSINKELQELFNPGGVLIGYYNYNVGDPVVFTRNNYASGYMNGDCGIVRAVQDGMLLTDDVFITGQNLRDVSLAYATTVHKAQGSECENAIILLPNNPKSLLRNDLLYVAATRARKKNIFIIQEGDFNALDFAVHTTWVTKRKTGLKEKIRERREGL